MANICVMGLGKLGLPLAALYAEAGHTVVGIDPNAPKRPWENSVEPGLKELCDSLSPAKFNGFKNFEAISKKLHFDLYFVVVPTPSLRDGNYNITFVCESVRNIGMQIGRDQHPTVVIVSTVNPGDTAGLIAKDLNDAAQKDVRIVYSPEFIALGDVLEGMRNPEFVLAGRDGGVLPNVFIQAVESITDAPLMTCATQEAELAKVAINSYLTTKISFANMITALCEKLEVSATNVLNVVGNDSRIGTKFLRPGGPYGGPCLPRDNSALARYLSEWGVNSSIPWSVDGENERTFRRVLAKVERLRHQYGVSNVGILGLTYKANTTVTEGALGPYLIERLCDEGVSVSSWDPLTLGSPAEQPEMIGRDTLTVLANPDPLWKTLDYFDAAAVLDVWGILDTKSPRVHRIGEP